MSEKNIKHQVVVGRKWNHPNIYTLVTSERIEMKVSLDNFLVALTQEMGNPTLLVTQSQLLKALTKASAQAIEEIKKASIEIV